MKRRRTVIAVVLAVLVATGLAGIAAKETSLDKLPDPVRATIERVAEGNKIHEIELEKEHGILVYEVEMIKDGKEVEFMVNPDGELLGYDDDDEEEEEETPMTFDSLPVEVRTAAAEIIGDNPVKEVSTEKEYGVRIYEVEYTVEDVLHEMELTERGDVLEVCRTIEPETMPTAALRKLRQRYPNAVIKEAEAVQVYIYELEIEDGGKTIEVELDATGRFRGGEDMEDDDHHDDDDDYEEDDD